MISPATDQRLGSVLSIPASARWTGSHNAVTALPHSPAHSHTPAGAPRGRLLLLLLLLLLRWWLRLLSRDRRRVRKKDSGLIVSGDTDGTFRREIPRILIVDLDLF